ncbi:MAG: hypothetical protein JKY49_02135 [Cohaesibacteraceae bacterium]|nr:hypothetical protein [Cohaesibacteraceae bacterium]
MTNQITLLLADDDEEDLALLQDAVFLSKDYIRDVKFVTNGIVLLHRLRGEGMYEQDQNIRQPDLVVIDPGASGFMVTPHTPEELQGMFLQLIRYWSQLMRSPCNQDYKASGTGFSSAA